MDKLSERDRRAVVLRYFSGCAFAQIGAALGVSEDAARMRVERALDRLRLQFQRKGISSTNAILAAALTGHAIEAAPPEMTATVAQASLNAAAVMSGSHGLALLQLGNASKSVAFATAVLCAAVGGGLYVFRSTRNAGTEAVTTTPRVDNTALARIAMSGAGESRSAATPPASAAATHGQTPSAGQPAQAQTPNTVVRGSDGRRATLMALKDVLGPNHLFHDEVMGVAMTYPEGWTVRNAIRWGQNNSQNTVFLSPETATSAVPSMYYQRYPSGNVPPDQPEAYLRQIAQWKENSRVASGLSDYKNVPDSFVFNEIDGHPAMSYFATYSDGDEVKTEYFIRILGRQGYVMFFTEGRLEDVTPLMPQIEKMAATVKVP